MPGRSMTDTAATAGQAHHADLALHRHAGVVGHLLARAGQQVEQRGLAAIGVAHQGHVPWGWRAVLQRRRSCRADLDAVGFQPAQRKHAFTHHHGQRLAPAGAAAQQLHRLTGDETQLAQALQRGVAGMAGILCSRAPRWRARRWEDGSIAWWSKWWVTGQKWLSK